MRLLVVVFMLFIGSLAPAVAETPEDRIIAALHDQGYEVLERQRTFLGRMWLLVENDEIRREIVFNPGTGEILRDYSVLTASIEPAVPEKRSKRKKTVEPAVSTATAAGEGAGMMVAPLSDPAQVEMAPALPEPILPSGLD